MKLCNPTQRVAVATLCWLAAGTAGALPDPQTGFPMPLDGTRVRYSSISLGDLNGDSLPEIVVGTADGKVHAYEGKNGSKLWDYDTGDMAIEGKAAIADVDGDGFPEVVVGAGSTFTPNAHGALYVLSHTGGFLCSYTTLDNAPADGWREGVFSSPAVADLVPGDGGKLEIAFGSFDRRVRVIDWQCHPVWENNVYDSVFGSPAIGDVNGDGQLDVVIGVDADADSPDGYGDGGLLYVYDGATGDVIPPFPKHVDEVIWSSPALGDITGDGNLDIVVGTGYCWETTSPCPTPRKYDGVGEYVIAWDHQGNVLPGWPVAVAAGTHTFPSPALADLDNDGILEVIINSRTAPNGPDGRVYALNGDGSDVPGWPVQPSVPAGQTNIVHTSTEASPVVADVTGDGNLEVLLPSAFDLVIWDRDGVQLTREGALPMGLLVTQSSGPIASSAAVGDLDGDGDLEVVVGSATSGAGTTGQIYAWDFDGAATAAALAWPMFRHTADNRAIEDPSRVFTDGFESGDVSLWSSSAP